MRNALRLRLGLMLAGLFTAAPVHAAACKVGVMAELPVTMAGRRPMVAAKFGGKDARFILDSGAFYSTLSRASAAEFGLKLNPAPGNFRVIGIGGDSQTWVAEAKDFTLAGIALPHASFVVAGSDTGTAGLLGQNILGLADVEYDLPHGFVRLMKVDGCGDKALAYWANGRPFSTVPLERADGVFKPHTVGTVTVNGVRMRAIFDSGAEGAVMTLAAAKRAGITPTSPGVTPASASSGLGSRLVPTWRATFDTIDIGGEILSRPQFRIADLPLNGDMLIGADFFLTHRMFVSNARHLMYLSYEGGPVFGLTPRGARTAAGERLVLSDTTGEPTDAEGFSRRGAVAASNRRLVDALADFDRAVALAPDNGRYLYQRAQARLANRQPLLAAADLDKAATLAPADPDIRLTRARLRLVAHDSQGAAEDVRAADQALPPMSDRRLQVAVLYEGLDQPEAAIVNYDQWLKLHGQDADRASAFNGRCWARALLNRELDTAEADCAMAVKLRPGNPSYLDSRALVELRQGRLDAALRDYDASLQAAPRNAWSLYGRSVAAARAGRAAQASADRAAALALNPAVVTRAERYGLQ